MIAEVLSASSSRFQQETEERVSCCFAYVWGFFQLYGYLACPERIYKLRVGLLIILSLGGIDSCQLKEQIFQNAKYVFSRSSSSWYSVLEIIEVAATLSPGV